MKCTYCKNEIGEIKEVYVAFCKVAKNRFGMILNNTKNETVGWISETRMYCKKCRPSALYTLQNWTLTNK